MSLPAMQTVAALVQSEQQQYQVTSRFCDLTFNRVYPGGATPSPDQVAQTEAIIAGLGTLAAAYFAGHYAYCGEVLAHEQAMGATVAHPWLQANGLPGVPPGWTMTPVLDANANPTGALQPAYTAPAPTPAA